MATQVQYRRGTNAQVTAFTGALGELVIDTTNKVVVVNDGVTTGGFPQVGLTASQTITNKVYQGTSASVTGNVDGGNLRTSGLISSTGNITGGNLSGTSIVGTLTTAAQTNITSVGTLGSLTVTANVAGGNLTTAGQVSATGNITGGNISATNHTGTTVSVTGNITGGNLSGTSIVGTLTTAAQTNITSVGTLGSLSVTGNITGGNILTGGNIVDTVGPISIVSTASGNVNLSPNGTNVLIATTTGANVTGTFNATGNIDGGNLRTAGQVSATGNITGAYLFGNASTVTGLSASKIFNGTTEANVGTSGGNANISVGGTSNVAVFATTGVYVTGLVSATGNITGGNLSVSTGTITGGNIVNSNANGVGNIGSSTTYFNTVFAKATSAQYADLAENYIADQDYPIGTLLIIGGDKEVRSSQLYHDPKVVGTVSDKPAYIMNSGLQAEHVVTVALLGRVPCRVVGTIARGDLLVSSELHGVATVLDSNRWVPGCVIGKALEEYSSSEPGTIEIMVGRY